MEDLLRAGLQRNRGHCLRHPVGTVGTPENPRAATAASGISTARTGGGKYVPDDIRFQILYRLSLRSGSKSSMDTPSAPGGTLVGLNALLRLPHQPLRYLKRLAFRP